MSFSPRPYPVLNWEGLTRCLAPTSSHLVATDEQRRGAATQEAAM